MNYLGHMILSGEDENTLLGNFIGDHISNKILHHYSQSVQEGIHLHRAIDLYTDSHPKSRALRAVLFDQYRHRSRVILDLFYDHFLATHFEQFHPLPLSVYVQKVYDTLQRQLYLIPASAKHYFLAMKKYGWLEGYASTEGIRFVLNQMSKRKDIDPMGNAVNLLNDNYSYFKDNSFDFLEDVTNYFGIDKSN
ncbi:ACP phosphodiesterase [Flavobacteriaceae bacterium]|nr:ACP phosphodiesterase [Flavobacteriaceae bacterium]